MRIAVIHPSFAVFGGTEKLLLDLYPALVERGHSVTLFTTGLSRTDAMAGLPGVDLVDLERAEPFGDERMFAEHERIGRLLADRLDGFDIVRTHGLPSPVWWLKACEARPELELEQIPSTWSCGGILGGLYDDVAATHVRAARTQAPAPAKARRQRDLARLVLAAIRRRGPIDSVRRAYWELTGGRRKLIERLLSVQDDAIRHITTVVTDSEFVADQVRTIWGARTVVCPPGIRPPSDMPVTAPGDELLTVSRLQESKNIVSVLRAVAALKARGPLPFSRYVIVGDGVQREMLEELSRTLGIDDSVVFEGSVANDALTPYFDRAGVFVLPALDEGFGVTYLEAALRARATIGPDHGGPAEIVLDGETGWVVTPTDVSALADAIDAAFADAGELARRGVAAKSRAETEFCMRHFIECTERVCLAAIGRGLGDSEAGT